MKKYLLKKGTTAIRIYKMAGVCRQKDLIKHGTDRFETGNVWVAPAG
jgi:hypothetical protein